MITLTLAARIKPEAADRYKDGELSRYGVDRWFMCEAGMGLADSVVLSYPNLRVPIADLQFCATPFICGQTYEFDATARATLLRDHHSYSLNTAPDVEGLTEVTVRSSHVSEGTDWVHFDDINWSVPHHLVKPRGNEDLTPELAVAEMLKTACLSGCHIFVTRFRGQMERIGSMIPQWLKHGGYIYARIEDSLNPMRLTVQGRNLSLSQAKYIVPDQRLLLALDEICVTREVSWNGTPLNLARGGIPECAIPGTLVRVITNPDNNLAAPVVPAMSPQDTGFYGHMEWHELRKLSPAEKEWVKDKLVPPRLRPADIEEALGPTLRDLIRSYPESTVSRGLVFARTETQLKPEDKDYGAIVARLMAEPGKLAGMLETPSIELPRDMYLEGEKWWMEQVGIKLTPPAPPKENPLALLGDNDLVLINIKGTDIRRRVLRQEAEVQLGGSLRVPARIVRQGHDKVMSWARDHLSGLPVLEEGKWGDSEVRDVERSEDDKDEDMNVSHIDYGALDEFVVREDEPLLEGDMSDLPTFDVNLPQPRLPDATTTPFVMGPTRFTEIRAEDFLPPRFGAR